MALVGEENNIPSPRGVSQNTFHAIKNPGGDERAKRIAQQTTTREDSGA